MSVAAVGLRVHSGWALCVVVRSGRVLDVLDRRRIDVTDDDMPGGKQPYHHVAQMKLHDAERYLAAYAIEAERRATSAISDLVRDCYSNGVPALTGCAIFRGSGREFPDLAGILASHATIHAAEGNLFRSVFAHAFEHAGVPVTWFVEGNLEPRARETFGGRATQLQSEIVEMVRRIGSPWTKEHRAATLAAAMLAATSPG